MIDLKKKCITCKEFLLLDKFHKDKYTKDGCAKNCKLCRKKETQLYYQKNKEKIKSQTLEYYKNHKPEMRAFMLEYQKKREKEDILFRLSRRLRNRLYYAMKRTTWKKGIKFNEYIGCSLDELKSHLFKQFTDGMSWDNYGEWEIDHIKPLSSAKTEDEIYQLCHFTNLQPLWAKINRSKSNKVV